MNAKVFWIGTMLLLTVSLSAFAQQRDVPARGGGARGGEDPRSSPSDLNGGVHPDLLLHMQEIQRYESRNDLARQAAVEKAQQRRARLAASRWYGHSPLRPMVSSIPMMGSYFPVWSSDVTRPTQWFHVRAPSDN